jgi:predicted nucleotidyltransferase component of viral defense system
MANVIFDQMLSRYVIQTDDDQINALHEVMQQVTLAGLYRAGFFNQASFYGGTCLRIFHGLPRFSEDLDFSLLQADPNFRLENYFEAIIDEFKALGREVQISKKEKQQHSQVESAFLKETTAMYNVKFQTTPTIKIKIEVDTNPPEGFGTEPKLLLLPFSFMVRCYTLPNLFAGKMHAFLFRNWNNRVKGRDWYDVEWYVRNNIHLDFGHFLQRAHQTHGYTEETLTTAIFKELLRKRIRETDIHLVKRDVLPFIKDRSDIDIWSEEYFLQLADHLRI